jgi:hypothetical protein
MPLAGFRPLWNWMDRRIRFSQAFSGFREARSAGILIENDGLGRAPSIRDEFGHGEMDWSGKGGIGWSAVAGVSGRRAGCAACPHNMGVAATGAELVGRLGPGSAARSRIVEIGLRIGLIAVTISGGTRRLAPAGRWMGGRSKE